MEHDSSEAEQLEGRCPLCRTELSVNDVLAAPVPAVALELVPGEGSSDPKDPTSPRRVVMSSPRRHQAPAPPSPAPAASGEESMVLVSQVSQEESDDARLARAPGWSTKLQAILDELDHVNREYPGEKVPPAPSPLMDAGLLVVDETRRGKGEKAALMQGKTLTCNGGVCAFVVV